MKKFLSVTLALLILFNLTSCYRPNTIFRTERSDLYAVTCFSVPYIAGNPEQDYLCEVQFAMLPLALRT